MAADDRYCIEVPVRTQAKRAALQQVGQ
ncbi:MAG: hypothetical protein B7Z09_05095 [Brevundimonas diminuta]|nr:MAG: hypothetical protein B7Z09_05095 [Brevundimonas diminuta]